MTSISVTGSSNGFEPAAYANDRQMRSHNEFNDQRPHKHRANSSRSEIADALAIYDAQYLPGQPKSLSGIATRSFLLGNVTALSIGLTVYLLLMITSPLWRIPFFISVLGIFHFLEFWTTAAYNTSSAEVSSFLLTENGPAYQIAHGAAIFECLATNLLFPNRAWLPPSLRSALLGLGLVGLLVGQATRSIAMIQAGTNFAHIIQYQKSKTHRLVTNGVYAWLRHPSYFGFFWWGLATQLMLGNVICLCGYVYVLWTFFARRIRGEERLLREFFEEYDEYKAKTRVGIPFIS